MWQGKEEAYVQWTLLCVRHMLGTLPISSDLILVLYESERLHRMAVFAFWNDVNVPLNVEQFPAVEKGY